MWLCLCVLAASAAQVSLGRHVLAKRQLFGNGVGGNRLSSGGRDDYQLPYYSPYPGRSASGVAPTFPFTTAVNGGLGIDGAWRDTIDGFLNVPVPTWGLWDLKGGLDTGQTPLDIGFGVVANPTNPLKMSPQALRQIASDPRIGRAGASSGGRSQSAGVLPSGVSPLNCRPPLCNPFVQTTGVGVDVDLPDDVVAGGLDFPIPLAENGVGTRFPLSGGLRTGQSPVSVNYAHHVSPVDPFKAIDKQEKRVIVEEVRQPLWPNSRSQGLVTPNGGRKLGSFARSRQQQQLSSDGIVRSVFRRRQRA